MPRMSGYAHVRHIKELEHCPALVQVTSATFTEVIP
jgi:hypothetical protein